MIRQLTFGCVKWEVTTNTKKYAISASNLEVCKVLIGESSPNLFLNMINLYPSKIWSTVNLERTVVSLPYNFVYFKVNFDLDKSIWHECVLLTYIFRLTMINASVPELTLIFLIAFLGIKILLACNLRWL